MNKKKQTLSSRVVAFFLLFSVLSLAALVIAVYFVSVTQFKQETFNKLQLAGALKESALNEWFETKEQEILLLADSESTLSNADLQEYLKRSNEIVAIRALNIDGEVSKSTTSEEIGAFLNSEPFFIEGKNQIYTLQHQVDGEYLITISAPIINQEGIKSGVFSVDFDTSIIDRLTLDYTGLGDTGESYFVSKTFTVISPTRHAGGTYTDVASSFGVNAALAGGSGVEEYLNYRGIPVLGYYRFIPSREIAILVEIYESEVIRSTRMLTNLLAMLGGGIILFLALVLYLVTHGVTQPIKRMSAMAKKIGEGNLSVRSAVDASTEIGGLADSLDLMAEKLQQTEKEHYEFITTSSHQLRRPVSDIKFKLSILIDELSQKKATHKFLPAVESLRQSSENAAQIMEDLLAVLLLKRGFIPTKEKQTSLPRVMKVVIDSFAERIAEKQIKLSVSVQNHLVVHLDEEKFKLAMVNLLDNAITYSERQGVIHVIVKERDEDILVSVADQGIGIPTNEHLHVFTQFFRAKNSYEKKIAGTGLGLYIARLIVEDRGGEIFFKSEEGKGTIIYFTIPKRLVSNVKPIKKKLTTK